jgi:hypothetical protein
VNGADASDGQYEGSKIFSGAAIIELTTNVSPWTATYWWESEAPGSNAPPVVHPPVLSSLGGNKLGATISISSGGAVTIIAALRFVVSAWR